jgi:peroxiredoxin
MSVAAVHAADDVATSATEIRPLLIGTVVPELVLKAADGSPFDLNDALGRQPTVLIFYRGGW